MNLRLAYLPLAALACHTSALAQTATPSATPAPTSAAAPKAATKPIATVGGFNISGHLRSRVEYHDFFAGTNGDNSYVFTGHQLRVSALRATPKLDLQLDLQQQLLTNLPENAFFRPTPATAIPLGQGGNYYAANGGQDGALNVKQAFVRFKGLAGQGSMLRVGRFEFNDGMETTTKDGTLNFLKAQRLSQHLVGTFGYTHTGRAFDGAHFSTPAGDGNLTLVGAKPTVGVFELEANDNVNGVAFLYGAYTKPVEQGDARLFAMAYQDERPTSQAVKTDNRPAAVRGTDNAKISVYTLGGNFIKTFDTSSGKLDVLTWGALQAGDWGALDHSGHAFALEAGYQPKNVDLKPWFRLGYYQASGDKSALDGKHGTFFTPLPTPRIYARYPFYNQMNVKDLFAQAILRPNPKTSVRLEAHSLKLENSNDLWYYGGGAFQDRSFGIVGSPSGGNAKLANVLDLGVDYAINPQSSLSVYVARAMGGSVVRNTFAGSDKGTLGFVEYTHRF